MSESLQGCLFLHSPFSIIIIIIIITEYYLSAVRLEKKLLEHFTEVAMGNDNVTRGNLHTLDSTQVGSITIFFKMNLLSTNSYQSGVQRKTPTRHAARDRTSRGSSMSLRRCLIVVV